MSKGTIIREHYPVADLPEDLREGFPIDARVRIVIESDPPTPDHVPTLDELLAMRKAPFRTTEEIVAEIRRDRDEWDD